MYAAVRVGKFPQWNKVKEKKKSADAHFADNYADFWTL